MAAFSVTTAEMTKKISDLRAKHQSLKLAGAFLMEIWLKNEGCSNYS